MGEEFTFNGSPGDGFGFSELEGDTLVDDDKAGDGTKTGCDERVKTLADGVKGVDRVESAEPDGGETPADADMACGQAKRKFDAITESDASLSGDNDTTSDPGVTNDTSETWNGRIVLSPSFQYPSPTANIPWPKMYSAKVCWRRKRTWRGRLSACFGKVIRLRQKVDVHRIRRGGTMNSLRFLPKKPLRRIGTVDRWTYFVHGSMPDMQHFVFHVLLARLLGLAVGKSYEEVQLHRTRRWPARRPLS
jgi:hypothetical protein